MEKIKVNFNLSKELVDKLNSLPRSVISNKSKLVEELLEKWYEEERNRMEEKVS